MAIERPVHFGFYTPDDPRMATDFQTYLRCARQQPGTNRIFNDVFGHMPPDSTVLRNGAGTGHGVQWFRDRGIRLILAEPHEGLRGILHEKFDSDPGIRIIADTFERIDLGGETVLGEEVRHLFYHIPDAHWGPLVIKAARRLADSPKARLLITLKCGYTHDQWMLKAFGAEKYDLLGKVTPHLRRHPEFQWTVTETNATIHPENDEDAIAIARFMMCDRGIHGFPGNIDYTRWESYVLEHLARRPENNPWRHNHVHLVVSRNPYRDLPTEGENDVQ